jgi:hypothetical protein
MLHAHGGYPVRYVPPKSRPLYEQVALIQRIALARCMAPAGPGMTWDEVAAQENIPKRTLQHFYKSSIQGAHHTERHRRRQP